MTKLPIEYIQTPSGAFLAFTTDAPITPTLRTRGAFEPHLPQIAIELHRRREKPGVLVDIGAHIGTFAVPVALATGCSVHAFDAQRLISQLLGANFVLNSIEKAWVRNLILGGPGHPARMTIPAVDYSVPGNFGAYSVDRQLFDRESLARMRSTSATETVDVAMLDDLGIEDIFLVKLDVEGQELAVLNGSLGTLERNGFPPLLFESWREDWWREQRDALLKFVESLGYEITAMDENFLAQHHTHKNPLRIEAQASPQRATA